MIMKIKSPLNTVLIQMFTKYAGRSFKIATQNVGNRFSVTMHIERTHGFRP